MRHIREKIKKEFESITKENYDNDYNGDFWGDNFKNKVKENLFNDSWKCGLNDKRWNVNCIGLKDGEIPYYIVDEIFEAKDNENIKKLFADKIEEMKNEEEKSNLSGEEAGEKTEGGKRKKRTRRKRKSRKKFKKSRRRRRR